MIDNQRIDCARVGVFAHPRLFNVLTDRELDESVVLGMSVVGLDIPASCPDYSPDFRITSGFSCFCPDFYVYFRIDCRFPPVFIVFLGDHLDRVLSKFSLKWKYIC